MKKICHTTTMFLNGGGADLNIYYGIKEMINEYEFHLIVGKKCSKKLIDELKNLGVKIYIINELVREISIINDIKAFIKIKKIIKNNHYDIVYTHNAKTGVLARLAAYIEKVPVIIHGVHGISFSRRMPFYKYEIFKIVERIMAKVTTIFISVGENLVKEMLDAKVGKKEQYKIINSGMDLERFLYVKPSVELRKKYANDKSLLICVLARLDKRKGHKYFIEAFSKIVRNNIGMDIKAIFVGNGSYEREIHNLCKKYEVEDKIFFTGYVPNPEKYLAISDIICLTSEWEGIPQSLVQASAVGKPIVAFNVNGIPEIVEDGFNGYLVEFKDINMLYEKLVKLIHNKELRIEMGKNSVTKVDDRWDINTMVTKTKIVYNELLKNK